MKECNFLHKITEGNGPDFRSKAAQVVLYLNRSSFHNQTHSRIQSIECKEKFYSSNLSTTKVSVLRASLVLGRFTLNLLITIGFCPIYDYFTETQEEDSQLWAFCRRSYWIPKSQVSLFLLSGGDCLSSQPIWGPPFIPFLWETIFPKRLLTNTRASYFVTHLGFYLI